MSDSRETLTEEECYWLTAAWLPLLEATADTRVVKCVRIALASQGALPEKRCGAWSDTPAMAVGCFCTEPLGHTGKHVARRGVVGEVLAEWETPRARDPLLLAVADAIELALDAALDDNREAATNEQLQTLLTRIREARRG